MYTSFALVALSSTLVASSHQDGPTWQKDYVQARKIGQTEKRPLAVVIGQGADGCDKVCRDGKLSPELQKMLAQNYVCVYIDSSTPEGQKLASDFAVTTGKGLILSDRTGDLQAFHHDGDLSTADLSRWLTRFADPNVAVRTTATNSTQLSMYPPENGNLGGYGAPYMQGYYQGGGYYPAYFGGGCPGGNCGGGGRFRR
jgi:hypothetical protein